MGFFFKATIDVGIQRFRTMNIFFKGNSHFRDEIFYALKFIKFEDYRKYFMTVDVTYYTCIRDTSRW
jgi:hypothetical protein